MTPEPSYKKRKRPMVQCRCIGILANGEPCGKWFWRPEDDPSWRYCPACKRLKNEYEGYPVGVPGV